MYVHYTLLAIGITDISSRFLFTLSPIVKKYHWTKANSFFMMIEHRSFMFGGGRLVITYT
jgi:hypothetical protein